MKLFNLIKSFRNDEDGAVTVDWVVLTAAIVGLGIAVLAAVSGGVADLSTDISNQLLNQEITTEFSSYRRDYRTILARAAFGNERGLRLFVPGVSASESPKIPLLFQEFVRSAPYFRPLSLAICSHARTGIGPRRGQPEKIRTAPNRDNLSGDQIMKLFNLIKSFRNDEDGAVTVDWVVLTAAIVGLGIAVLAAVSGGVADLSTDISNQLLNQEITTEFSSYRRDYRTILARAAFGNERGLRLFVPGVSASESPKIPLLFQEFVRSAPYFRPLSLAICSHARTGIGPRRGQPEKIRTAPNRDNLSGDQIMKLFNLIKSFRNDEDGAVTVDWVVLTAAIVGLGIAVLAAVSGGVADLSTDISNQLLNQEITTEFSSYRRDYRTILARAAFGNERGLRLFVPGVSASESPKIPLLFQEFVRSAPYFRPLSLAICSHARTGIGPRRGQPEKIRTAPNRDNLSGDQIMKLFNLIKSFRNDEDGAVTVDWVVLTAAIVGLGIAVLAAVSGGVADLSTDISNQLLNQEITTEFSSYRRDYRTILARAAFGNERGLRLFVPGVSASESPKIPLLFQEFVRSAPYFRPLSLAICSHARTGIGPRRGQPEKIRTAPNRDNLSGDQIMKLFNLIKSFRNDEDGAVTVDWVVLTAAIVGLGIAVLAAVSGGVADLSTDISNQLLNQEITTEFSSYRRDYRTILARAAFGNERGLRLFVPGVSASESPKIPLLFQEFVRSAPYFRPLSLAICSHARTGIGPRRGQPEKIRTAPNRDNLSGDQIMKLFNLIKSFRNDEDGAVTVDWVVLTAAIVGLGIAVLAAVSGGVADLSTDISNQLLNQEITTEFSSYRRDYRTILARAAFGNERGLRLFVPGVSASESPKIPLLFQEFVRSAPYFRPLSLAICSHARTGIGPRRGQPEKIRTAPNRDNLSGDQIMKLFNLIKSFRNDEDGAVTVDWVVLTAAIVGLGIAVLAAVSGGVADLSTDISNQLLNQEITTEFSSYRRDYRTILARAAFGNERGLRLFVPGVSASESPKIPLLFQEFVRSAPYFRPLSLAICSHARTGIGPRRGQPEKIRTAPNRDNLSGDQIMKLFNLIKSFRNDEDGAVTVDWVVLTAAIVGLGIAVLAAVSGGVADLSTDISNQLLNQEITTEFSSYRRDYRTILARAAFGNERGLRLFVPGVSASESPKIPLLFQEFVRSAPYFRPLSLAICSHARTGIGPRRGQPEKIRTAPNRDNLSGDQIMKLFNLIKSFRNDEDGAVTVDWVVLTAAIVGLGIAVLAAVSGGVADLSTDISNQLLNQEITTEFSSYRRDYRTILARAAFGNERGLRLFVPGVSASESPKIPLLFQEFVRSAPYFRPLSLAICSHARTGIGPRRGQPEKIRTAPNRDNLSGDQIMKLFNLIKSFRNDEDGAVTVDWVVLTAAIVGLGIAVLAAVSGGVADLSTDISNQLLNQEITTEFSSYRRDYRTILARAAFGNERGLRLFVPGVSASESPKIPLLFQEFVRSAPYFRPLSLAICSHARTGIGPRRGQPEKIRTAPNRDNLSGDQIMKLFNLIKSFRNDEDGAVTVDWVVLTAAIVGLGIAVLAAVSGGVADLSTDISNQLLNQEITTEFSS